MGEHAPSAWRVLVVDDDARFAAALADAISSEHGLDVVGVADGVESGSEAVRAGVDVVLLDVRMPGGGGAELARRVSRSRDAPAVVAMSGSWDSTSAAEMADAGAVATVDKSDALDELCAVVRGACERRAARTSRCDDRADTDCCVHM